MTWAQRGGVALGAVLLLACAFSAGRFSAPLKVEEREVERVVYRDRVVEVEKIVEVQAKAETKIVYRDRVVKPDGEVHEREVERTDTREDTSRVADSKREAEREATRERVVEKVVTLRPDWRVGVLAGATWREPAIPLAGPLVLGAQVDRRIIGGLSVGVWFNTVGAAGAALTLEF